MGEDLLLRGHAEESSLALAPRISGYPDLRRRPYGRLLGVSPLPRTPSTDGGGVVRRLAPRVRDSAAPILPSPSACSNPWGWRREGTWLRSPDDCLCPRGAVV